MASVSNIDRLNKAAGQHQHNAAGVLFVAMDAKTSTPYLLMGLQRKEEKATAQWHNTLALMSGKREKAPKPEQKAEPTYEAQQKLAAEEEWSPVATAAREAWEESGGAMGTKAQIIDMINKPTTIALLNNGFKRWQEQVAAGADPATLEKPFVVVTFVVFLTDTTKEDILNAYAAVMKADDAPALNDSAGLAWVDLNHLLPAADDRKEGSAFFTSVFIKNENYVLPADCTVQTAIRTGPHEVSVASQQGGFSIASFVARTLANDYDNVMAHIKTLCTD